LFKIVKRNCNLQKSYEDDKDTDLAEEEPQEKETGERAVAVTTDQVF
jgi:hypothetical protein